MESEFACTLSDGQAGFSALMDDAEAFLARRHVPDGDASQIMVALDEIVSNILYYGAEEGIPTIRVRLRAGDGLAAAEIIDDGVAFDPLDNPAPATDLPAEERPIGGLGIHLVRKMMDEVRYDRDHGQNRLRFHKRFALEGPDEGLATP